MIVINLVYLKIRGNIQKIKENEDSKGEKRLIATCSYIAHFEI